MTYPPRPYRSDRAARISYALHHRTLEIAIGVLVVTGALGLWLGGDYSPIEMLKAKGGL